MTDSAYRSLAFAYDEATGIKSMDLLTPVLDDVLSRHQSSLRTHLDLACGTGLVMRFFEGRGYTTRGVDISSQALSIADAHHLMNSNGDLRNLPMLGTFAVITCVNDSLRVLTSTADVLNCFQRVAAMMTPQSLFLFDITKPATLAWLIPMGVFPFHGANHDMELRPAFANAGHIERLRFNGRVRFQGQEHTIDEVHDQGVYSREEIVSALGQASLHAIEIIEFERYQNHPNTGWFFVVRRVSSTQ